MDDRELDRIDLCHVKYGALLDKKLFLAPISGNPQRILDLGCGTGNSPPSVFKRKTSMLMGAGIWCIEVAEQYDGAQVCLAAKEIRTKISGGDILTQVLLGRRG